MIDTSLARSRPVSGLLAAWDSTVGKKFAMAITGVALFGYVVLHLWGNLRIFVSPRALDQWGVFLRVVGDPVFTNSQFLWIVRIFLAACLVVHIVAATQLTRRDLVSRPVGYSVHRNLESTYASRTMRWGGVFILLFIVFHVLDLTTGTLHPSNVAPFQEGRIFENVVGSFLNWYMALIYIAAVAILGLHLYHGIWSFFQTLGLNSSRSNRLWRNVATVISVALTLGNIAIPLAVLTRIVR